MTNNYAFELVSHAHWQFTEQAATKNRFCSKSRRRDEIHLNTYEITIKLSIFGAIQMVSIATNNSSNKSYWKYSKKVHSTVGETE